MKGLELSERYYEAFGKSMIQKQFSDYEQRIAVGLVGDGSECLGYDDALSQDHDFGPGFCLWLTREDFAAIGRELTKAYENRGEILPGKPQAESGTEIVVLRQRIIVTETLGAVSHKSHSNQMCIRDRFKTRPRVLARDSGQLC